MELRAVRADGTVVKPGDLITTRGSKGETYTFVKCIMATQPGKSGKVMVGDGTEYTRTLYAHIFSLVVEVIQ